VALIVPFVELPPVMPLTFQVTVVFEVLETVAVNCFVRLTRTVALVGEMLMLTGGGGLVTLTAALPTAEGTATLVACTVTFTGDGGAVYRPVMESMNPAAP
jgi:hypothetical protein